MLENIIVSTLPEYVENTVRVHWTYLHGELESEVGYDVYTLKNCNLNLDTLNKGIYKLNYNGKICLLYYWTGSFHDHGLVVYEDDIEANNYAQMNYDSESSFI